MFSKGHYITYVNPVIPAVLPRATVSPSRDMAKRLFPTFYESRDPIRWRDPKSIMAPADLILWFESRRLSVRSYDVLHMERIFRPFSIAPIGTYGITLFHIIFIGSCPLRISSPSSSYRMAGHRILSMAYINPKTSFPILEQVLFYSTLPSLMSTDGSTELYINSTPTSMRSLNVGGSLYMTETSMTSFLQHSL